MADTFKLQKSKEKIQFISRRFLGRGGKSRGRLCRVFQLLK
jgi:hypothetical protein